MNLIQIKEYRKLLKFKQSMCLTMALLISLGLGSATKNRNNNNKNLENKVSYSAFDETAINKGTTTHFTSKLDYVMENTYNECKRIIEENKEPTYAEKMLIIMEREHYTYNELDEICAGCVAESYGTGDCYDEGYDIASVFYNRTHYLKNVTYIGSLGGGDPESGYSMITQFEAKNQFSVFKSGGYKKWLGRIDIPAYQGAIDMFYSGIPSHNYLQFNDEPPEDKSYEQLNPPKGNYFYTPLNPEARLSDEVVREAMARQRVK